MKPHKCLAILAILILALALPINAQSTLWETYFQQGMAHFVKGNYAEAERLFRICVSEAADLKDSERMLQTLNALGNTLSEEEKYGDAERVGREYLQLVQMTRGENDPSYTIALNNLGLALSQQHKYKEAEAIHRRALSIRERNEAADSSNLAISLINLGKVYYEENRVVEAEALFNRALLILTKKVLTEGDDELRENMLSLADCDFDLGLIKRDSKNYGEAEKYFQLGLLAKSKILGEDHPSLVIPLMEYAKTLRLMKRLAEASRVEARAKAIGNKRSR
jgi:tetratricopeptide (TPR) repeat protein